MLETILWWLTIELLGLVALPVAMLLFRGLPDRGYTAAKPLGLLLVGWLAYTLAMVKVLPFERWGLLLCALVVAAFSAWLLLRDGRALLFAMRERFRSASFLRHVLAAELLFAILLAAWAFLRAYNPDILDQEKFMDFGILNSILKSGTFPPHDMWLSGQSLNYYYFGYILIAVVTSLSGVTPAISFNLANAALFALTAFVAYGVVYNLIQGTVLRRAIRPATAPAPAIAEAGTTPRRDGRKTRTTTAAQPALPTRPVQELQFALATPMGGTYTAVTEETEPTVVPAWRGGVVRSGAASSRDAEEAAEGTGENTPRLPFFLSPILYGILGALLIVAMGNLAAPFGKKDATQSINGNGWSVCFFCAKTGYGYWWDPSRIILDYTTTTVNGQAQKTPVGFETINEFPAFSFVLGDMHPHMMALPFVLLALLAAYAVARRKVARSSRWRDGVPNSITGWIGLLLTALIVGMLYPTNTWDYPTYMLIVLLGMGLPYLAAGRKARGGGWQWLKPYIVQAALLFVISLLLFLPFHLTFKSFAGGEAVALPDNIANIPVLGFVLQKLSGLFLINTADKTITGFLVIFGTFLVALLGWLGFELFSYLRRQARQSEQSRNTGVYFAIFIVATLLVALLLRFPLLALLLPIIVVCTYLILQEPRRIERNLALGLVLIAATIGLSIEVIYLHDNFGNRMNTLFKFYYQLWVLFSLAAAYGFWRTLNAAFGPNRALAVTRTGPRGTARTETFVNDTHAGMKALSGVWAAVFLLLVASSATYVYFAQMTRNVDVAPKDAQGHPVQQGLDGSAFLSTMLPGDDEAIKWLNANATGQDVLLECCRNEYDLAGRFSAFTGIPTLIAWDNSHEALWRSSQPDLKAQIEKLPGDTQPTRRQVVDAIYQGKDPDNAALPLTPAKLISTLNKYGVTYVVVGDIERGTASPRTAPFDANELLTPYAESVMKAANLKVAFQSQKGNTTIYSVAGAKADPNVVVPTPLPPTSTPQAGTPQPDLSATPVGLFSYSPAGVNKGQFSLPRGITRDAQGDFYVTDTENKRVQKFDLNGNWLLSFGSNGQAVGQFGAFSPDSVGTGPGGIAADSKGNIYVADTWNHRVQKFDSTGKFLTVWGTFINLSEQNFQDDQDKDVRFYGPRGVAVGPNDHIYVTDTGNKRVLIFDTSGNSVGKIDSGASPQKVAPAYPFNQPGELNEPVGIAVDPQGNVFVADTDNKRIQKFDQAGKAVAQWPVPAGDWDPGPYLEPFLALDGAGNVYATAPTGKTVLKYSPTGQLLGSKNTAPGGKMLGLPTGITVDKDGTIYVVDTTNNAVVNLGKIT